MALDTTLSGLQANSYATVNEADTYFANHYSVAKNTVWSGLSQDQKENALKTAASMFESLPFTDSRGPKADVSAHYGVYRGGIDRAIWNQRLTFPRNIDYAENAYFIPQEVKDAQCEQAVYLVNIDESVIASQIMGLKHESIAAGPVRTTNDYVGQGALIAPMAYELLRPFIRRNTSFHRA